MSDKIKDNPSFKELEEAAKAMNSFNSLITFLGKLGIKSETINKAFKDAPELIQQTNELINLPDKFNEYFGNRGWIIYGMMNGDLAKTAVILAEQGKLDEAEQILVEYFNEENITWLLRTMNSINAFKPRIELAQSALQDYLAGRFHASVPLVLMIIDGLMWDIKQSSFFAETTDTQIWDSVTGHSSGLSQLKRLFTARRSGTTTEDISIPYRHGILHGRDLGYGNKLVAAKTWSCLFAIADWARDLEKNQTHTPEKKDISFKELFNKQKYLKEQRKLLDIWVPRNIVIGHHVQETGEPDVYSSGTPERTLATFFDLWKRKNYGGITNLFEQYKLKTFNKSPGEVKIALKPKEYLEFKFLTIKDEAPAISVIDALVSFRLGEEIKTETISVRMIYKDPNGDPQVRGSTEGEWKIMPAFLSKLWI